jgi:hypothetical protein
LASLARVKEPQSSKSEEVNLEVERLLMKSELLSTRLGIQVTAVDITGCAMVDFRACLNVSVLDRLLAAPPPLLRKFAFLSNEGLGKR